MDQDMLPHISKLTATRIGLILRPIRGVVFDVDGTLTVPGLINFKRIHEDANVPIGVDIFPYIRSHFTGDEYKRAMDVVEREELKAAENIQLQPGADELICFLNSRGIRVALLTRNSKKSLDKTISLFTGKVDLAFSREIQPSKPHTDPFVRMASEWGIPCESLLLAGDHLDDFIPALALSATSCYVRPQYNSKNPNAKHIPVLPDKNGLSLANCLQSPDYIMEYKKTHTHYVPTIVVDNIGELGQAWQNLSN